MMTGNLQPLDTKFAITGPDGRPTDYFIRWAQQRQIDISGSISAEQALQIVQDYVTEFITNNPLIAGSGIDLSPSGILSDGVTISAQVQEILDQITSVQGSILFRGAADWEFLAPGTAGEFLQTSGAGADPVWAAAGGGGGSGSWTLRGSVTVGAPTPTVILTDITDYTDLMVLGIGFTASAASLRRLTLSDDNGATFYTAATDYQTIASTGQVGSDLSLFTSASSALGRSVVGILHGAGQSGLTSRLAVGQNGLSTIFVGSANPIDAVRVALSIAGNITGGTLEVYTR